ncbi:MAG: hypothetical protein JW772_00820 [Candidatus Diapherotrites archaeon]|nr:hypothetical protein [Candidatus Diapherotrites archaeon]
MFENFYKRDYRPYIAIAVILFVAMSLLAFVYPGFTKGLDLSGGTLIIARTDKPIDGAQLESILMEKFDLTDLSVSSIASPTGYGVTIKYADSRTLEAAEAELEAARAQLSSNPEQAKLHAQSALDLLVGLIEPQTLDSDASMAVEQVSLALIEAKDSIQKQIQETIVTEFGLTQEPAFQIREVSPTLGASFWQTAINVVIVVIILVVLVVFFFFRELIPSFVVLSCGLFDELFCLGVMALIGIPISLNTIPALLMLFGYSIDTDVMLASRILKRREATPRIRAGRSMLTGFTMTGTTLAAVLVMIVLSYVYQVEVIFEIGSVLFIGLIGDLIGTWLWSAPVLLWDAERSEKKLEKKMRV